MAIVQEWEAAGSRHRLADTETQEVTEWAGYTAFTYLNGMAGFTAYYAMKEGVLPANEFCALVGVGKAQQS